MKIIDGNRFALQGVNGETVTVTVIATGTKFLVAYRVQGAKVIGGASNGAMQEGTPLRFKLDNTAGNRNKLSLGFTFASRGSVSGEPSEETVEYEVKVTGSAAGSDTSREIVSGSFNIPADNRQWRFAIAGQ